jgi:hypothetical protein
MEEEQQQRREEHGLEEEEPAAVRRGHGDSRETGRAEIDGRAVARLLVTR